MDSLADVIVILRYGDRQDLAALLGRCTRGLRVLGHGILNHFRCRNTVRQCSYSGPFACLQSTEGTWQERSRHYTRCFTRGVARE